MSKMEEKNSNAGSSSAEEINDREFERWVKQQFMEEAAAIEKEIDEIPDSEDWEPTEEKFQKLLQKVKEQGCIDSEMDSAQTKVCEDRVRKNNSTFTKDKAISEKLNNEKLNMEMKKPENKDTGKRRFTDYGEKVIKWTAVAAVTVFGIFGVSMTSEANRAYIMEKVDVMLGNDVGTKINNDEMLGRATTEDEARAEIEDTLEIELPQFYYMPDGMEYLEYSIDKDAQIAFVQYTYQDKIVRLMALANDRNATSIVTRDVGKKIDNITSNLSIDIVSYLWEIYEAGDDEPTYILQWRYKNYYYELMGKISKEEMEKMAREIMF